MLGLNDCRDLATAARFLDSAGRFEAEALPAHVEELCGPDTAPLIRAVTSKLADHVTGADSLRQTAKALRILGLWRCATAGRLDACSCLQDLERQAKRTIRANALDYVGRRFYSAEP
ncbi:hypothetical protein [Glycomyces tarimensis]